MFAEACPGNPSRVKQQAGVKEVSSSLLHCCHHFQVQGCDRLINSRLDSMLYRDTTHLNKNRSFKKMNLQSLLSVGGMYSRSVHV